MLIAGNYRCVQRDAARSIKDAVHTDLEATRAVYNWVVKLCLLLGAAEKDLVPFEKYANAALSLGSQSSARARAVRRAPYTSASTAWCQPSERSQKGSSPTCSTKQ